MPIYSRPHLPYNPQPIASARNVRHPPNPPVNKFGASCFHCGCTRHCHVEFPHARAVANPNPCLSLPTPFWPIRPGTPYWQLQQQLGSHYQHDRVKHNTSDRVLADTGASIHLSGALRFATHMHMVFPFPIFFSNSNSSIKISQITTLKLPIKNGTVIICEMVFSDKIPVTILSMATAFKSNCLWINIVTREGTNGAAAVTPPCSLIEINPISKPTTTSLSSHE
ncbi:hypothetical protein O181_035459 [Austropuccinia psidii MF-1]|uniref:Uncharacterized protein n=1 Tax=Austropuccinia psidii MF-1 TaxID=1389203 RepID=A0A9Q3HAJ7_9BASI|nr:hypothetical protein [Austropuccinia psidii MF-1]